MPGVRDGPLGGVWTARTCRSLLLPVRLDQIRPGPAPVLLQDSEMQLSKALDTAKQHFSAFKNLAFERSVYVAETFNFSPSLDQDIFGDV